jgi:nicotinamide-nucleotide amidase
VSPEDSIAVLSQALVGELVDAGKTLATAESCSGGWIAKALTDVPGSSAVFGYGIVSYSNDAKVSLLGVGADTLERHGAVSEQTVLEMAQGALATSGADVALAVSGIAGPDGGTAEKPVGTVWFAWARRQEDGASADAACRRFAGDRTAVREQSVVTALQGLRERLRDGRNDG